MSNPVGDLDIVNRVGPHYINNGTIVEVSSNTHKGTLLSHDWLSYTS